MQKKFFFQYLGLVSRGGQHGGRRSPAAPVGKDATLAREAPSSGARKPPAQAARGSGEGRFHLKRSAKAEGDLSAEVLWVPRDGRWEH